MANIRKSEDTQFERQEIYRPQNEKEKRLVKAFTKLTDDKTAAAFLRDLMTVAEIKEFANRLEIARLLQKGHSYKEIADKTNVSTTTVTRVAHWLFHGCGGYQKVLEKEKKRRRV